MASKTTAIEPSAPADSHSLHCEINALRSDANRVDRELRGWFPTGKHRENCEARRAALEVQISSLKTRLAVAIKAEALAEIDDVERELREMAAQIANAREVVRDPRTHTGDEVAAAERVIVIEASLHERAAFAASRERTALDFANAL